ncbi:uncharacterized protein KGF55_005022 [Candida pseudojiufengensis]|uniref:uncharacterized protein n=1 Tax=Candida pseudojiufengensis TaxID=497109 RepID=UPI0022243B20|nr:uncharacterized protein KGF55_005022 [Candida pseudojiufengensis]KAI5959790.1 hypothetical protein KGF55_005022 [Candida pseudojiufengensis]
MTFDKVTLSNPINEEKKLKPNSASSKQQISTSSSDKSINESGTNILNSKASRKRKGEGYDKNNAHQSKPNKKQKLKHGLAKVKTNKSKHGSKLIVKLDHNSASPKKSKSLTKSDTLGSSPIIKQHSAETSQETIVKSSQPVSSQNNNSNDNHQSTDTQSNNQKEKNKLRRLRRKEKYKEKKKLESHQNERGSPNLNQTSLLQSIVINSPQSSQKSQNYNSGQETRVSNGTKKDFSVKSLDKTQKVRNRIKSPRNNKSINSHVSSKNGEISLSKHSGTDESNEYSENASHPESPISSPKKKHKKSKKQNLDLKGHSTNKSKIILPKSNQSFSISSSNEQSVSQSSKDALKSVSKDESSGPKSIDLESQVTDLQTNGHNLITDDQKILDNRDSASVIEFNRQIQKQGNVLTNLKIDNTNSTDNNENKRPGYDSDLEMTEINGPEDDVEIEQLDVDGSKPDGSIEQEVIPEVQETTKESTESSISKKLEKQLKKIQTLESNLKDYNSEIDINKYEQIFDDLFLIKSKLQKKLNKNQIYADEFSNLTNQNLSLLPIYHPFISMINTKFENFENSEIIKDITQRIENIRIELSESNFKISDTTNALQSLYDLNVQYQQEVNTLFNSVDKPFINLTIPIENTSILPMMNPVENQVDQYQEVNQDEFNEEQHPKLIQDEFNEDKLNNSHQIDQNRSETEDHLLDKRGSVLREEIVQQIQNQENTLNSEKNIHKDQDELKELESSFKPNQNYINFYNKEIKEFFNLSSNNSSISLNSSNITCDGSYPTSKSQPGSTWSSKDKNLFFNLLSRYSIHQLDLISEIMKKSSIEIMIYYNLLKNQLKILKQEDKNFKLLSMNDIPFAFEISEEFTEFEDEQSKFIERGENSIENKDQQTDISEEIEVENVTKETESTNIDSIEEEEFINVDRLLMITHFQKIDKEAKGEFTKLIKLITKQIILNILNSNIISKLDLEKSSNKIYPIIEISHIYSAIRDISKNPDYEFNFINILKIIKRDNGIFNNLNAWSKKIGDLFFERPLFYNSNLIGKLKIEEDKNFSKRTTIHELRKNRNQTKSSSSKLQKDIELEEQLFIEETLRLNQSDINASKEYEQELIQKLLENNEDEQHDDSNLEKLRQILVKNKNGSRAEEEDGEEEEEQFDNDEYEDEELSKLLSDIGGDTLEDYLRKFNYKFALYSADEDDLVISLNDSNDHDEENEASDNDVEIVDDSIERQSNGDDSSANEENVKKEDVNKSQSNNDKSISNKSNEVQEILDDDVEAGSDSSNSIGEDSNDYNSSDDDSSNSVLRKAKKTESKSKINNHNNTNENDHLDSNYEDTYMSNFESDDEKFNKNNEFEVEFDIGNENSNSNSNELEFEIEPDEIDVDSFFIKEYPDST